MSQSQGTSDGQARSLGDSRRILSLDPWRKYQMRISDRARLIAARDLLESQNSQQSLPATRPLPHARSPRGSPPPPAGRRCVTEIATAPTPNTEAWRRLAHGGEMFELTRSTPQEDEEPRKLTRGGVAREVTQKMRIPTHRG